MRGTCVVGLVLVAFATSAFAEESFPYKIKVKTDGTAVRSGPGDDFYRTSQLAAGDEVQVYKRAAGGWLGIRPREDSFNWVEASKLRMTNDPDIAKVVGSNVVAWIGSNSQSVGDHKWQVQLDAGESVRLMARKSMSIFQGDEPRDFYQIAPPSGDFRWVRERDILPLVEQEPRGKAPSEIELAAFQVVEEEVIAESTPESGFVDRAEASTPGPTERVASLAPRKTFRPSDSETGDFDALAKSLEIGLSDTVAKSPSQWKLASLRQDAEALIEQSDTTLHRGKARLLLEKIKQFEKLQLGYAGIDELDTNDPPTSLPSSIDALEIDGAQAASELNGFDPRFDGRGWLLPVHSSRQASPPYALLDQKGQILTFVSPAPGLNLHRYLRKEVGLFGQRSRAQFLKKPHLTADRIVDLDRHRR